jgi:hypothetical protein
VLFVPQQPEEVSDGKEAELFRAVRSLDHVHRHVLGSKRHGLVQEDGHGPGSTALPKLAMARPFHATASGYPHKQHASVHDAGPHLPVLRGPGIDVLLSGRGNLVPGERVLPALVADARDAVAAPQFPL